MTAMFRYKLRTLLILLAVGPPVLAGAWFVYGEYRARGWRNKFPPPSATMATQPFVPQPGDIE